VLILLIIHFAKSAVYIDEVDPYKKPKDLLEVSPKGLVPGLRFENFNPPRALNESTVILEYLEEYVSLFFLYVVMADG
jgi:glutathione S-transferase